MIWFAVGLAVLAAGSAFLAHQARGERRDLLSTDVVGAAELHSLHAAATEAAGQNAFSQRVELSGRTGAHMDGLVTSELTDTPCVWYRQKVTRRYEEVRRGPSGQGLNADLVAGARRDAVVQREEVVADNHSTKAFFVVDETGKIAVIPEKWVKGASKVLSEFRPAERGERSAKIEIGSFSLELPSSPQSGTIGFEYEEWVLAEGTAVFVQGEAMDKGGKLSVSDPRGEGRLLITTESEDDLLEKSASSLRNYTLASGALTIGSAAALIFALVR